LLFKFRLSFLSPNLNQHDDINQPHRVGTAVEHHTLYQYQFANTKNIYAGFIQTETPYYQPNPSAPYPFTSVSTLNDPVFPSSCPTSTPCANAWGLRILNSNNILIYGAGLYSFFDNYSTTCSNNPGPENCQSAIASVEGTVSQVHVYCLSTVGTTNMLVRSGSVVAVYSDNNNVYPDTIALYTA
jgi:glucan 1,3-beta-glucosidase